MALCDALVQAHALDRHLHSREHLVLSNFDLEWLGTAAIRQVRVLIDQISFVKTFVLWRPKW